MEMIFQTIIIIPKGVVEGFYNGWIDSYYKTASLSIGGWKIVFLKLFFKKYPQNRESLHFLLHAKCSSKGLLDFFNYFQKKPPLLTQILGSKL